MGDGIRGMAFCMEQRRVRLKFFDFKCKRLHWILGLVFFISASFFCRAGKIDVANKLTTFHQNQFNGFISVNLSQMVIDNAVNITCRQLQSGSTKANLLFGHLILPIGSRSGNISVSIISAGDSVTVSCYGFSLNNGNQYLLTNSTGESGNVIVTMAPSVSICSDFVYVKGYTKSIQSFTIQLSEPAVSPVIVNCFVSSDSAAIANSLQIRFSQAIVLSQQTQATVTFSVQMSGQQVKVFCHAQSQNCLSADNIVVTSSIIVPVTNVLVTASNSSSIAGSISNTPNDTVKIASLSSLNGASSVSSSIKNIARSTPSLNPSSSITFSSFLPALTAPFSSKLATPTSSSLPAASATLSLPLPTTSPLPSSNICQYLFNTSQASSVNFVAKQPSITAYPSYMDYNNQGDHVSYVVLDEALEGSVDLALQCRIKQISIADVGSPICGADGLPLGGAQILSQNDITIKLKESQIIFKPGSLSGIITIQMLRVGNQSSSQLFHAFCCAPTTNEKYRSRSVSVFVWVDGKGTLPFDWTNIPDQLQRKMTVVESLDFTCPCNLNQNFCDVNCCCDKDCSSAEISRFICTTGAFGGREVSSFEFDCNAVWPDRTDWSPILCVVTNNSPLLGYFFKYTSPSFALALGDFQTLTTGKTIYTFEENEARKTVDTATTGYTFGASIKTDIGVLTVPSTVTEPCAFSSIRFLMDKASYCLHKVSRDICTKDTLNSLNFILLDGLTFPSCSVPGILDGRTSTSRAPKTVEYYCLTSSSNYIRQGTSFLDTQSLNESLFSSAATGIVESVPRCKFDNGKTRPPQPFIDNSTNTCQNAVLDVNYVLSWNAQQIKAVTAKITLGSIPLHTLTESAVTYTYYTQRIVTSSIIIPINSVTQSLSQSAPSLFPSIPQSLHSSPSVSLPSQPSLFPLRNSTVSTLSSPSASANVPVSSASRSNALSTATPVLTTSSILAPSLITPSTFRLSNSVITTPNLITFTVKTSTVISRNFTLDPSVIQKFTVSFKYEKSVNINASVSAVPNGTTSTVVSRSGNPGYVTGKPLISRISSTANVSLTDGLMLWKPAADGLCTSSLTTSVPFGRNSLSGCSIRIGLDRFANCSDLSSMIKETQDKLVKALQIAKRGNPSVSSADDWLNIIKIEPASSPVRNRTRSGICYDIPSHVVFEVLISEAGMRYGEPQMEISGLRIRYVTETWSLNCTSGKSSGCYNSTNALLKFTNPLLKSFHLTSSVVFVKIPAVEPPQLKRSIVTTDICKYDSCLQELFYPIMDAYSSNIAEFNLRFTQSTTAVAMTLIFIAFGALYASDPWR